MPRSARSSKLETRSSRLKLPVARKPTFVRIGPGVALGYRRNQTAGTRVVRVADGKGGPWSERLSAAEDLQIFDGCAVIDLWPAQEGAGILARGGDEVDDDTGE